MITDSITSWMNVWLSHVMSGRRLPDESADGSANSARTANAYAHHIVPTTRVSTSANRLLNPVGTSEVCGGPDVHRDVMCGLGACWNVIAMALPRRRSAGRQGRSAEWWTARRFA